MTLETKQLAAAAAWLADDKRADDIVVIHVEDRLKVADYFVIATGLNRPHVRALFNELHVRLKAAGEQHKPMEGNDLGWWVVLDYGDVVVHLMQKEAREYYELEHLYGDCPRLDWKTVDFPDLPEPRSDAI